MGYLAAESSRLRPLRHRHRAHVLRHLVTLLNCRTRRDRLVPALHIRILLQIDRLPFETGGPWPDRDVCDGVLISDEFATLEPGVEHLVKAMPFLEITLFGVRRFAFVVFHEVVHLPEHG